MPPSDQIIDTTEPEPETETETEPESQDEEILRNLSLNLTDNREALDFRLTMKYLSLQLRNGQLQFLNVLKCQDDSLMTCDASK